MAAVQLPTTMRAWQFSSTKGGMEKNLHLNSAVPVPQPKPNEHLVRVIAASLNPADYKPADVPIVHLLIIPKPATPGSNFVGRIIRPAEGSSFKEGQLIFGSSHLSFMAGFALADYAAVPEACVAAVPHGLSMADAASIPMAGLTAWQSTMPYISAETRIFINGGSGGVGCFAIQLAKQAGAHVTVSCSTANVDYCKSLGADDVVDYKKAPLMSQLQSIANDVRPFDVVVDNVGGDYDLYWKMHTFTTPAARFVMIGASPGLAFGGFMLRAKLLPGFLGGGKRKLELLFAQNKVEQIEQIAKWMVDGKLKSVVGMKFPMDQVVDAYKQSKSGRTRGKIVVEIESETA